MKQAIVRLQVTYHKARKTDRVDFTRVARNRAYADLNRKDRMSFNDGSTLSEPFGPRPIAEGNTKMKASTERHSNPKATGVRQEALARPGGKRGRDEQ